MTNPSRDEVVPRRYANSCACGWRVEGSEDAVVEATIDHGKRIHNMDATREQVIAALHRPHDATSGPTE